MRCRTLVEDKIGLKDVPKDLSRVGKAIANTGSATERKVGPALHVPSLQRLEPKTASLINFVLKKGFELLVAFVNAS